MTAQLNTAIIIEALNALLEATPETEVWKKSRILDQIELLKRPKLYFQMHQQGGSWLASARRWMQHRFSNGSDVTWGSEQVLHVNGALTVYMIEMLAAQVAASAINDFIQKGP